VGDQLEVLFLGNFRHAPNIEAAEFLIRRIAPRFPNLRFVIRGTYLPDLSHAGANVSLEGWVADTRELYRRPNTIVTAPLFSGTGQRVKLLEAFSMGCPVITTSRGAYGFPITSGIEALIADTEAEFAGALGQMCSSREVRLKMGDNARRMIESRFSWNVLSPRFLAIVEEAAAR
jgi:polysaccharide biosynthesis protein PslH